MAKKKVYLVLKNDQIIKSFRPGRYAGIKTYKVFGRLNCGIGMTAKKENRVFFLTWADAIGAGYRPCKNCRPMMKDVDKN
ncbi:metal-binding protein [Patescibacteria group bacterium]|nr:metal-binding protein [Patescibacteria group bacterium]